MGKIISKTPMSKEMIQELIQKVTGGNIQENYIADVIIESVENPATITNELKPNVNNKIAMNRIHVVFIVDDKAIIDSIGHMLMYDFSYHTMGMPIGAHYILSFFCYDNKSDSSLGNDGSFAIVLCPFRAKRDYRLDLALDVLTQRALIINNNNTASKPGQQQQQQQNIKNNGLGAPKGVNTGILVLGRNSIASKMYGDYYLSEEYMTKYKDKRPNENTAVGIDELTTNQSLNTRAFRTTCNFDTLPMIMEYANTHGGRLDVRQEGAEICTYCKKNMI